MATMQSCLLMNYSDPRFRAAIFNLVMASASFFTLYWELGSLTTGFERIPPQSPRMGTDYGDLLAGLGTVALYAVFVKVAERRFRLNLSHPCD
jgi:hypothetical protein